MRKLGKGQSVVFCVAEEIRTKIHDHTSKRCGAGVSVADVLRWAVSETYAEIRQSIPLWAEQGLRFVRHEELWSDMGRESGTPMSREQAGEFLEAEAQTIESRYRPRPRLDASVESAQALLSESKVARILETV